MIPLADRLTCLLIRPIQDDLPIDVQAVGLREEALLAMEKVADVERSSLRYKHASDNATILLDDGTMISLWQHNSIGVLFRADGKVHKEVVLPSYDHDDKQRHWTTVSFERDGMF